MTDAEDIEARIEALRGQLAAVYKVKGKDLATALGRARRLLPRPVRKAGAVLVDGQRMLGHPGLERMVDFAALRRASDQVADHLEGVDVADLRKGRLLALAGMVAFNVILVAAGVVVWMVWSGRL